MFVCQFLKRLFPKCNKNVFQFPNKRYCSLYKYEMPEQFRNSFFLANASLHDNINWYYYTGIEVAFNKFGDKFTTLSLNNDDYKARNMILNKISMLDSCSHVLEIRFPVMRDSGRVQMVKGICVKHGIHQGIHLGGLRIGLEVKKSYLRGLAALTSFKHACADVPFGGGHTGIEINPIDYSPSEIKRTISTFMSIMADKNFVGINTNIFEPELNCSSDVFDTVLENFLSEKEDIENDKLLPCISGKPVNNGGISNFDRHVAEGIFFGVGNFLKNDMIMKGLGLSKGCQGKSYIIKGLGKYGGYLVELFSNNGAKCIGLCEKDCCYYNKDGIDIKGAIEYQKKNGKLKEFFPVYNEKKIMFEECDMMILSEMETTLTYYNAPNIRAKIVVEAASGLITPTAHKILLSKNILILPDIFVTAGSSIVSYLELVKNMMECKNTRERLTNRNLIFSESQDMNLPYLCNNIKLKNTIQYNSELASSYLEGKADLSSTIKYKMDDMAKKINQTLEEFKLGLDVRTAAYVLATEKILELLEKHQYK